MWDKRDRSAGRIRVWAAKVLGWCFSLMALIVALAVALFPAYKRVPAGYIPVGLGVATALVLYRQVRLGKAGYATPSRGLLGIVIAVLVVQATLLILLRPQPLYDARFVLNEARELAKSGRLSPLTYYPPLQIWFYALWIRLFGPGDLVAQLSNLLWAAAVIGAVYLLGSEYGGRGAGIIAAAAIALYPTFILYTLVTPYYFYAYTFFIVVGAWLLVKASRMLPGRAAEGVTGIRGKGVVLAFLAGVASGLGALTKAVLLIAPLQAAAYFFLLKSTRSALRLLAGLLCGFVIVLGPWVWRNYVVFRAFVPVCTSGGFVLYSANNPDSNGLYSPLPDEVNVRTPAEMLAASRQHARRAIQFICGNPRRFLVLAAKKFIHTWGNEATYGELVNVRGRYVPLLDRSVSLLSQWGWCTLAFLWLMVVWGRRGPVLSGEADDVLIPLLVLSHAAVYLVFEGGARHHLPLVPLLMVFVLNRWLRRQRGAECG